jgi:hypothetical protein
MKLYALVATIWLSRPTTTTVTTTATSSSDGGESDSDDVEVEGEEGVLVEEQLVLYLRVPANSRK